MWIHLYFATYKVSGLQWEGVTNWVCVQGEITVVIGSNMFHSLLWKYKIQLSIEQAVSACSPFCIKTHLWKEVSRSFQRGRKKETSSLPFVLCSFWDLVLLKDVQQTDGKKFPNVLVQVLQQHQLKTSQSSYTQCSCVTLRQSNYFSLYFSRSSRNNLYEVPSTSPLWSLRWDPSGHWRVVW